MAVKKLTQLGVDRLSPPADKAEYYWDSQLPGFGVRVSPKGKKSWVANTRVRGKLVPTTLGSTDLIPSIAQAREMARAAMLQARQGINPIDARRAKAVEDKATAEAAEAQAKADAFTVAVLCDQFSAYSDAKHKPSTARETRRLLGRVKKLSGLKDRPAASITKSDVKIFTNAITPGAKGELERCNQVVAWSRAFKWAVDTGKLETNPCEGVKLPARGQSRDRVLTDDEIKSFWEGCTSLGRPFGDAFKLLIITGQRRGECCGMRWEELDDPANPTTWVIPASRSKNGKPNTVHLHRLAREIIRGLPRFRGPYCFSTTGGVSPIRGYGWAKHKAASRMAGLDPDRDNGLVADWRLHDARRTVATNLQKLGVRLEVTESILNHVSGSRSGVVGIYQRHTWHDEKIEALNLWGDYLARLVGENVVEMRASAAD